MSQYKYNHQEQKASGIQFPAMLTQKNGQRYKMVSAEDIAWNVEMKDGSLINDTDDLLNYISKTSSTTEEIVNKTFTTYRIDCDVTVCYEGDKFEQNPAIRVYKITDGVSTLLSYEDVLNNLLIPSINSTASTCIIKYDEEGQYLNGIAETGVHILSLKREDTIVARLQITVLSRPESVHSTTIYTESQTIPKTPVGGSYEDGVFIAPIGWTTDVMSLNQDNTIWFSTGTVFSNNNTAIWSAPCMYITKEAIQNTDKYYSNGVAVYKAVSTKKLVYEYNEETFVYEYKLVTNTDPVLPPDNQEGDYEFSTGVITAPSEWEISPQKAVEQYFESIEQLIITNPSLKDYYTKQKYAYKIYVSFNTYTTAYNGSVYFDKASIGWTTPVEYLNIDDVLENAKATSNSITKDAFDQARKDLNNVSNEINKKLNDTEENIHTINSKIKSLQDSVKDYTQVGAIVDSLKSLYSWNRVDPPINGNYEYKIINDYSYDVFITLDAYTGKEWYDKYVYLTVEDKYYQYSASSVMLTTELYALKSSVEGNGNRISTLEASVNEMTPDKIRLQVSKGFLNNVTWTPIEDSTVDHTIVIEEKPSTDLISYLVDNVTDPIFGDTYKLKFSYTDSDTGLTINKEYSYRCDYPISTGFLNILSENLSLGVSQNINGSTIESSIKLTVGEEGSIITSKASKIILNGDVIAEAIKTKELNINNTTYLSGNGDVKFAQGNDKRGSIFNSDGTGSLAGGLISWENTGDLSVKGKITATSGYIGNGDNAWFIGTVKGIPAIYAIDGDNKISITTQYLEGGLEATPSWRILRDGTATFAKGNVMFNNDGSGYIGIHDNTTGETKGISITSNGNVSIDGINININASQQTQIISSVQDNLKEDDDFKNQIAGLVVTPDGTQIIGQLKTKDVYIGGNSCFFDGTGEDAGAGYVANGAISWDENGKLTIKGNYVIKGSTSEYGNSIIYKQHVLNAAISSSPQSKDTHLMPSTGQIVTMGSGNNEHSFYLQGYNDDLVYNIPLYDVTPDGIKLHTDNLFDEYGNKAQVFGNDINVIRDASNFAYNIIPKYAYIDRVLTSKMFYDYFQDNNEEEYIHGLGYINLNKSIINNLPNSQSQYNKIDVLQNENTIRHNDFYTLLDHNHLNLLNVDPELSSDANYLKLKHLYESSPWFRDYNYVGVEANDNNKYLLPDPEEYIGRTFDIVIKINDNTKDLFLDQVCGRNEYIYNRYFGIFGDVDRNNITEYDFSQYHVVDNSTRYQHSFFKDPSGCLGKNLPYIGVNAKKANNCWIKFMGHHEDSICGFDVNEDSNYYFIGASAFVKGSPYVKILQGIDQPSYLEKIKKAYNIPNFIKDGGEYSKRYKLDPYEYKLTPYVNDLEGISNPHSVPDNYGKCVSIFDRYLGVPKDDPQRQTVFMGYDVQIAKRLLTGSTIPFDPEKLNPNSTSNNEKEYTLSQIITGNTRYVLNAHGIDGESEIFHYDDYLEHIVYTNKNLEDDLQSTEHGGLYLCLSPIAINKIGNGRNVNLKLRATAKQFKPGIYGWVINTIDFIPSFRFFCYPLISACFKNVDYNFQKYDQPGEGENIIKDFTLQIQYKEWDEKSFDEKIYNRLNNNIGVNYDDLPDESSF